MNYAEKTIKRIEEDLEFKRILKDISDDGHEKALKPEIRKRFRIFY